MGNNIMDFLWTLLSLWFVYLFVSSYFSKPKEENEDEDESKDDGMALLFLIPIYLIGFFPLNLLFVLFMMSLF